MILVACTKTDYGPAAKLRIANSGHDTASYLVDVAFLTDNGATRVDTAETSVVDLPPGRMSYPVAEALSVDGEEPYDTCKIIDVTRPPSAQTVEDG
ncbi:MAG TPA: hypothetical protein VFW21_01365 [Mycobacterium sp.]|nr:hypothetical protein [Mycobacterium sp.]